MESAAISASNLSELELTLGEVAGAVGDAEQSVTYADRSGGLEKIQLRTTLAEALHSAGRRADSKTEFQKAEEMQNEMQPYYPLLYSIFGARYCDLLLGDSERAAWEFTLQSDDSARLARSCTMPQLFETCDSVFQRAAQTLTWGESFAGVSLLSLALDHLTLGRAALYASILGSPNSKTSSAVSHIRSAVDSLRRSGNMDELPRGLLTRAWLLSGPT